jgi:hypothetical protein
MLYCGALELVSASVGGLIAGRLYGEEQGTRPISLASAA